MSEAEISLEDDASCVQISFNFIFLILCLPLQTLNLVNEYSYNCLYTCPDSHF